MQKNPASVPRIPAPHRHRARAHGAATDRDESRIEEVLRQVIYCIRQGIFRKGSFGHYEIQVPTRGMEELRHSSDDKTGESAVARDGALPLTSREK